MGNGHAWLSLVLCVVYIVRKNAKVHVDCGSIGCGCDGEGASLSLFAACCLSHSCEMRQRTEFRY